MAADPEKLKSAYKAWMAATDDYVSTWRAVIDKKTALDLQVLQAKIQDIDRCLAAFHRAAIDLTWVEEPGA